MIKNGFTLAEVLISLAIIGVIASITLPTLNVNIQKQQVGPALAKAINTLETANALAIEESGVRTLDQIEPTDKKSYFDKILAPYILFKKESTAKSYYKYDLSEKLTEKLANTYTTKDGITFLREDENVPVATKNKSNLPIGYSGEYYTVYVDVNGNRKGPNALGKDLFVLRVDTKGTVIPVGGIADAKYISNNTTALWKTTCNSPKKTPTTPENCTGAIVDNGFKVIY